MATTENELKTLNKNVSEALSILKLYVGSSANLKNINDEQRRIVEGWKDVIAEEEDQLKQKRKFTERERDEYGRFIKKSEESTNTFMNMAKSVKGMFSNAAMGITSSIGNFASGIKDNLSRFFQAVKTQFLSLFGEESEWFDILSSIKDSITNSFKRVYTFIFKRTPSWAKKQIDVLKGIYKLQLKQMKMDFLDATGKKKKGSGWMAALTLVLVAMAAGIGAWLHRKLIVITKIFPIFKKLGKAFAKLEKLPFLGKLIKGIKFGFKWLGWPLTLILSTIDFIKGFRNTEGDLFEKIKGGLWSALHGFIELPIRFIGWIVEKIAGLFGVEITGVGDKITSMAHTLFNMIFDGWRMIFDLLKDVFTLDNLKKAFTFLINIPSMIFSAYKNLASKILNLIQGTSLGATLMDAITPIIAGVYNFFTDFWNSAVDWMASKIPNWLPGKDTIIKGLKSTQLERMEAPETSVSGKAAETDKMKIESKRESDKEVKKAVEDMTKTIKEENSKTGDAINAISQVQGDRIVSKGDVNQIPDETDNNLLGLANFNI